MPELTTRGQTLYYEVSGHGEPLVLIHSFLCSLEMWRPQIELLSQSHRVIAVDLRGHGKSAASLPHSLYDLVDDVMAVLDFEGVQTPVWCGLSIGGMIAMRAALRHPHRVRALVLLDTDGGSESWRTRIENRFLSLVARTIGVGPIVPRVLEKMFCQKTIEESDELIEYWSQYFVGFHVPSAVKTLDALNGRDDVLSLLKKVDRPTLVIHGEYDRALPPACGERLATAIPGSQYEVIADAGHLATLEAPETVGPHIARFLRQLSTEPPSMIEL